MENLTFEQLPHAVTMLTKEVSELKRLFIEKQATPHKTDPERFLSIQEASELLNLSVPTVYSKVSKGELPFMKRSKRLYFSRTELLEYLKDGRNKSNFEIEQEAETHLLNIKKGLKNGK
jgi:excisionase family DNA binding protein